MTRPPDLRPPLPRRLLAGLGAALLICGLAPAAVLATDAPAERYIVVLDGEYALDGSYALGAGYALLGQDGDYALDGTYALGREYALYALDELYALAEEYALEAEYALDSGYALFNEYALDSGYALDVDYALGSGYALAQATAGYALDTAYALTADYALYALDSAYALADAYALGDNYALARDYALWLVTQAGGTITADLSRQLGVMVVDSKNATFADVMSGYALVESVGLDFGWKQFPTYTEALASGALTLVSPAAGVTGGDPLEALQWNTAQIRAPEARSVQDGAPSVTVGVVDTGIDGTHVDFVTGTGSNVDCVRGADFTAQGPGIGSPVACVDNNFHGTHVAGIIAARANSHGVVGVAPDVTLVPIKVCDADGHCYASDVVEGITYAGDLALNVINMSFFVDDDSFQESTEFKCSSDATQRAFRQATERAIAYFRNQGGVPIAALGNSDADLAKTGECHVVPAQTKGVVGVASLGPSSEKAYYSNYGTGWTDVAAPGGAGALPRDGAQFCTRRVTSTVPGNAWACFHGTSMASPHAAGVAALIVSQFGKVSADGTVKMSPTSVESYLQKTAIDIGLKGYDECFGNGRIDALRAVQAETGASRDSDAPYCPEYSE
ncbi:MAG: S8 family serine peptidase [Chloroflexota bacterium]|nr:S8 family serine peptidase [Chloroflexota bacterium]